MSERTDSCAHEESGAVLFVTKEQIKQEARRNPPAPAWPFSRLSDSSRRAEPPQKSSSPISPSDRSRQ